MATGLSVFSSLHRWARGQDENFCTEGLIHLLRLFLEHSPAQAMVVIRYLTSGLIGNADERPESISIHGQVVSDGKRPDIEIRSGGVVAWIEVKVDSPVGPNQLHNYKAIIRRISNQCVVNLLWRGGDSLEGQNTPDNYLIWTELAEQLRLIAGELQSVSARVLTEDYLRFLRLRSLAMSKISASIVQSIADVESLIGLIQATTGQKTIYWTKEHSLTCPVIVNNVTAGWLGFNLTEPQWLFFTTEGHAPSLKLNLEAARELIEQNVGDMVGKHWTMSVDLSAAADLVQGSAHAQVTWLREYLLKPATQHAYRLFGAIR